VVPRHGLVIAGGSTNDTSGELQVFEKLPDWLKTSQGGKWRKLMDADRISKNMSGNSSRRLLQ